MRRIRRRLSAIIVLVASLLAAAGCVSVPTSGPVETVEGQQPGCQNCVNVVVQPPAPGAKPKEIVEGYLRATSYYQPNYAVARQFLSEVAAEKWKPEDGATIYHQVSLTPVEDQSVVRLGAQQVGLLGRDRTYTAHDRVLSLDFHLAKDNNGEWRIDSVPTRGLMVGDVYFERFYQTYDLYFIGNRSALVPNPIYIPALSNPANVASALVKALLNGPSEWLKPAVSTAIPPNTGLSVDSVTITNGIAEVPLSDSVLPLPEEQRRLLAAQIGYTLRQVSGVKGVLIKVDQQPYRVPGSDPNSLVIAVDGIAQAMDPVPLGASDLLYAVKDGAIKQVSSTDSPTLQELSKPVQGLPPVDALAVSMTNTDFAVTTDNRTALRHAAVTSEDQSVTPATKPLLSGVSGLLRPQFTRYREIWAIGRERGRQQMWMFNEKLEKLPVDSRRIKGDAMAFRISPDGSRMALVLRTKGGKSKLGLARIIRSDKIITVDGWRDVPTTQPSPAQSISHIRDVAWLNATELLVLGAAEGETAYAPFLVAPDAAGGIPQEGSLQNGNAAQLAVSPRRQTAIIVDDKGRTWKDDGNQWSPFLKDPVSTIAYPG